MKITEHTTTNLKVKDSAGCFWLFGLFFVVVAGFFVIGLMGAFNNLSEITQIEQAAAWFISLAGVAAGIWIIYTNPAIKTDFDKGAGIVKINKRRFIKSENENYPLSDIKDVVIKESKDDEGDPIFSVEMILFNNKTATITKTWLRDKEELERISKQIKNFLM